MISVIVFNMGIHSDFHLSFFQIEVAWRDFAVVTKLMKNFKSLYGFGGRCLKIGDVCMDFEPNVKVHNLISIYPKSIKLGQMINLITWSLMWWCQFIDWLKFETRPSSLLNFGMAYWQITFRQLAKRVSGVLCISNKPGTLYFTQLAYQCKQIVEPEN